MKKIALTAAIFLMMAAMAMAGPQTEGGAAAAAGPEGPVYGGTLTLFSRGTAEPASPSESDSQWIATFGMMPIQETLVRGDIDTYGPRGTGEYAFQTSGYIPMQYLTGHLLESWDVKPAALTMKVRKGIYWAPNEKQKAWMPVREMTADDIAQDINRFRAAPWGNRFDGILKDVSATDKYTVEVVFVDKFNLEAFYYFGWEDRSLIAPPEMIKAGDDAWENQVGTGPFMWEEYVPGSHMSYVKNPNYWLKTKIDGKEYQMPFIDRFVAPIIPDEATQIAALRTGRIDFHQFVTPTYWDSLEKSASDLLSAKYSNVTYFVSMLTTEPPFDNVNVRRAMMIGTDIKAHQRLMLSEEIPTHSYPIHYQHPAYTPVEKLPADLAELYAYDPAKAKKILADAGYPNGLTIDLYADSTPVHMDNAALLKDEWAKFGVTANIQVHDPVTHTNFTYHRNYHGAIISGQEIANPINSLYRFGHTEGYINFSAYSNSAYDAIVTKLATELDPAKQLPLMKEASLMLLGDVAHIPMFPQITGHYWWPWLKNYYGEVTASDGSPHSIIAWIWIDQDLKKKLGK
ncbi:MAG: ABC transporter substrate-binding protein [Spirochaetales bacterium]|nr:ABC transporter substrate-binding protein [Spirochaetales bacterium]